MANCSFLGPFYIIWLAVVAVGFSYNAWMIPLRVIFPYQTASNVTAWIVFDCIADFIYLIDLFAFKPHVKFIQNGFWVKTPKETLASYLRSLQFKVFMQNRQQVHKYFIVRDKASFKTNVNSKLMKNCFVFNNGLLFVSWILQLYSRPTS